MARIDCFGCLGRRCGCIGHVAASAGKWPVVWLHHRPLQHFPLRTQAVLTVPCGRRQEKLLVSSKHDTWHDMTRHDNNIICGRRPEKLLVSSNHDTWHDMTRHDTNIIRHKKIAQYITIYFGRNTRYMFHKAVLRLKRPNCY